MSQPDAVPKVEEHNKGDEGASGLNPGASATTTIDSEYDYPGGTATPSGDTSTTFGDPAAAGDIAHEVSHAIEATDYAGVTMKKAAYNKLFKTPAPVGELHANEFSDAVADEVKKKCPKRTVKYKQSRKGGDRPGKWDY